MATIIFVYLLGAKAGGQGTGLIAAALLALNGHHLWWSQQARFYSPACFVAAASCWALLRAAESGRGGRVALGAFAVLSLCGLGTIHYYWFLIVSQALWVAWREIGRRPRLLLWVLLITIAASPLASLALYQARPFPYLQREDFLLRFYSFGFLLEPNQELNWQTPWFFILPAIGALLTLAAWMRDRQVVAYDPPRGPTALGFVVATFAAILTIVLAYQPAIEVLPNKGPLLLISILVPVAGLAAALWILRSGVWERLPRVEIEHLQGGFGLAVSVAVAAPLLVWLASQYAPFYAPRATLLFTPALLVVYAHGLRAIAEPSRPVRLVACAGLATVLLSAHVASVNYSKAEPGPRDYATMAQQIRQQTVLSDRLFVYRHWSITPLYYYLRDHYGQLVGRDWTADAQAHPEARVWILWAEDGGRHADIDEAVAGRRMINSFRTRGLRAELYAAERVRSSRSMRRARGVKHKISGHKVRPRSPLSRDRIAFSICAGTIC